MSLIMWKWKEKKIMSRHRVKDEIEREDKKHIRLFIIVIICSGLFGGLLGFFWGKLYAIIEESGGMPPVLLQFRESVTFFARILTYVFSISLLAYSHLTCRKAKKGFLTWDGESEIVIEDAEKNLSKGLAGCNLNYLITFICFGLGTSQMIRWQKVQAIWYMVYAVSFIVLIFFILFQQRSCINLEKRMNPEKRASVFDLKFRKKWLKSCDEAETRVIYEAAYHAFVVVHYTCYVVLLIIVVVGMFFEIGLMSYFAVGVIWLANVMTYSIHCMKKNTISGC